MGRPATAANVTVTDVKNPATGHTEVVDAAVEPTCTETGLSEGSHCSVCNEVIIAQQVVPAKGHNMTQHEKVDPTCTEDGHTAYFSCDRCNKKYDDEEGSNVVTDEQIVIPATGHTEVVDAAVDSTCTETGLSEGSHCSVCNEVIIAQQVVPAKGHTEVIDAAVEPTCTETGLSEGSHCSVCNEVIIAQQVVPAKGHTEVIDEAVPATCTTDGKTEGSHCSVCNTVLTAQETVPALGHKWGAPDWTWTGDDENGYTSAKATFTCENDTSHTKVVNTENIDVVTVDPKPGVAGSVTYTATVIGPDEKEYSDQKVKTLSPAEYTFKEPKYFWSEDNSTVMAVMECNEDSSKNITETSETSYTVEKQPTCTDTGAGRYTATFTNTAFETQVKDDTIAALGHEYGELIPEVPATCEEGSTDAHYKCSVCGKFFDTDKKAILEENLKNDDALGHDYQDIPDSAEAATCIKSGKEADKKCSRCGDEIEGAPIKALGHKSDEGVATTPATCTTAGVMTYTCTVCKETLKTEEIAALGHEMGEYTLTRTANTSRSGELTKECSRSGCTETEVIVVNPVVAKAVVNSNKKATISWGKVTGAERYLVYFAKCNTNFSSSKSTTSLSYAKTGLKKGVSYKFKVVAQKKINGEWTNISSGYAGHFVSGNLSKNKKYTNQKSISVAKASVSIKEGETSTIKPSNKMVKSGKKPMTSGHAAKYRYLTNNSDIATVNKSGKITAKKTGTCTVYVIGINGISKGVKVTVTK